MSRISVVRTSLGGGRKELALFVLTTIDHHMIDLNMHFTMHKRTHAVENHNNSRKPLENCTKCRRNSPMDGHLRGPRRLHFDLYNEDTDWMSLTVSDKIVCVLCPHVGVRNHVCPDFPVLFSEVKMYWCRLALGNTRYLTW